MQLLTEKKMMKTNSRKIDSTVEHDDSETEPSNDNDGKEDDGTNNQMEAQDNTHNRDPIKQQNITIKPGCRTSYTDQNSNDKIQAEVLSRAGKASGSKSNWYNIRISKPSQLEGGEISVDLSHFSDL